ncbi:hypothetical protein [Rhizobium bangladeshense]|uniref:hypothetical protein n=1 Tax=Rhizobium bangladeshense TaxID=1138189 RepID=UPI0007E575E5|nr:hypothetical protein [Rhizobium bangladeshense]
MLPNAPTDNLYKFATFIGMALFVFCTWQISDTSKAVESQLFDAKMQGKLFVLRVKDSQEALEAIEQDLNAPNPDEPGKALKGRLDLVRRQTDGMLKDWEANVLQEARAQLREMQYLEDDKTMLQVGQWGGLALSVIGIVLWYVLHQRHQDGLLRQQRQSAESTGNN